MTGPLLMLLSRLGEPLVFGDALAFRLLFCLGARYSHRGRYPAASGNKAICDRDGFGLLGGGSHRQFRVTASRLGHRKFNGRAVDVLEIAVARGLEPIWHVHLERSAKLVCLLDAPLAVCELLLHRVDRVRRAESQKRQHMSCG